MAGKDTSGYADKIDPCVELGRAALDDGAQQSYDPGVIPRIGPEKELNRSEPDRKGE